MSERNGRRQNSGTYPQVFSESRFSPNFVFRSYMVDGAYQSVLIFWSGYFLFSPANATTGSGRTVDNPERMGVYIGSVGVVVANLYILFNTYRWDWLICLIVAISVLLMWFWTGVWTSSTVSTLRFYKAAAEVYSQGTFWALLPVTTIICLLPRFVAKSAQKIFFPRDIDIIREQVNQGQFKHLYPASPLSLSLDKLPANDSASTNSAAGRAARGRADSRITEDRRPFYAASEARTTTTHSRPTNGSDGTNYTNHSLPDLASRLSTDRVRPSFDRTRRSFDRPRMSVDRIRPSFEQSQHFTSAALLSRMESSQSAGHASRRRDCPEA